MALVQFIRDLRGTLVFSLALVQEIIVDVSGLAYYCSPQFGIADLHQRPGWEVRLRDPYRSFVSIIGVCGIDRVVLTASVP